MQNYVLGSRHKKSGERNVSRCLIIYVSIKLKVAKNPYPWRGDCISPFQKYEANETMVKQMMLYGVFVWYKPHGNATLVIQLVRVPTVAFIGIGGAKRTTPTMALIAVLYIAPVVVGVLLRRSLSIIWNLGTLGDLCHFDCIPDNLDHFQDIRLGRSRWRRGTVSFLMDESTLKGGLERESWVESSLSTLASGCQNTVCSVFQAAVAAIKLAGVVLLRSIAYFRICIHSDIRAAIQAR